jgi:hypothetical protein
MPLELQTGFRGSGSAYPEWHDQNYEGIMAFCDALEAALGEMSGAFFQSFGMPSALLEIFDRRGLVGRESYDFDEGTLTGPSYNLEVSAGGYVVNDGIRRKTTSTLISMAGKSTGTYYLDVDESGLPSVSASASDATIRSFDYDDSTHAVSNKDVYTGVSILFDGDEWQRLLVSVTKGETYDSLADRIEEIESGEGADVWASFYAEDPPHSGLNFKYKAGKVRNDSAIYDTSAGQVALTDDATNYVEVDPADGTVSANTTGFTSGLIPLYEVVTASGAISTVTDKRTSAIAGTGGGGGGHTQNTDTGTTNEEFTIDMDATGSPTGRAGLAVENGDDPNAELKYNRDTGKWQWTIDGGSTWYDIEAPNLSGQEFSKYVAVDDPPKVYNAAGRGSSADYEELDLSSYLTDAPDGAHLVTLAVFFTDTAPGAAVNITFRKAGVIAIPGKSMAVWSGATDPGVIHVEPDENGKIEFFVSASGGNTANVEVYLLNYVAKVTGVGTQERTLTESGISVAAADSTTQDVTSWLNRGLVHYLKVQETGGSMTGTYDIEIYGKDTYLAADLMYQAQAIDPATDFEDWLPFWYKDKDGTKELHVKIINNDASNGGTFTVTLEAEQFA